MKNVKIKIENDNAKCKNYFFLSAKIQEVLIRTYLKNHFYCDYTILATTGQKKFTRYAVYRSLFLTVSRSKFCTLATKAFLRLVLNDLYFL